MSDSELSDAPSAVILPNADLEASLRKELRKAVKAGDEVTVRSIRDASEKSLGLTEGFYKSEEWKTRSKDIIHDEHTKSQNQPEPEESPVKKKPKPHPSKKVAAAERPTKRPSNEEKIPPAKKRRSNPQDEESSDLSSALSDAGDDIDRSKTRKPKSKPSAQSAKSQDEKSNENGNTGDQTVEDSGSEMSVVLDDEPAKKRRSKSKDTSGDRLKSKPATKPKPSEENDPDKEEIKKLQGWLVKCGIRKVWGKELKPYESSKAKIKHLRGMLADAGMTGRFSNEKAAQIKEARELAADIEAVQEGNERWGKSGNEDEDEDDDGDNRTRGGRRIVRGAKNYDFLSSDGEETD